MEFRDGMRENMNNDKQLNMEVGRSDDKKQTQREVRTANNQYTYRGRCLSDGGTEGGVEEHWRLVLHILDLDHHRRCGAEPLLKATVRGSYLGEE